MRSGASPGTAATDGNGEWAGGGSYDWEINDFDGTAGMDPGWDLMDITGQLSITATDADPVLRTGARVLASDEPVRIAVALRVDRRGRQPGWVAPSGPLEIDGRLQDGPRWESWPEDDRQVRVFWFTVECATVGGEIAPSTAAPRLAHRTFLAPEMGRDLLAAGFPSQHNDDALGPRLDGLPTDVPVNELTHHPRVTEEAIAIDTDTQRIEVLAQ